MNHPTLKSLTLGIGLFFLDRKDHICNVKL